ncbi:Acetokinase family-domain-containing protein [Amylostereum chailletii]|nr:Acetokinase family-domain-containing protein [Amylostereum chailletii]
MSEQTGPRRGLILSLNSGSSSLKVSLYRPASPSSSNASEEPITLLLSSSITSILSKPKFSFKTIHNDVSPCSVKDEDAEIVKDHESGFAHFLEYLEKKTDIDKTQISQACHRVVHGGDYTEPVVITDSSYHHIERLSDLAPLHNGAALSIIKACIRMLPRATSIAFFDTMFHQNIPAHISSYALSQEVAQRKGLKKYGFHGLSYAYILREVSRHLKKPQDATSLIVLHLGSGASACAIQEGQSLDTSMGLTPASGLPGATRAGDIDPTLIFHFTHEAGRLSHSKAGARDVDITKAEEILNKQAGWSSLVGTTDFSQVVSDRAANPNAALAFNIFVDRIIGFLGAYFVKMGGKVDALVFAGGIGEKSAELRQAVGERCICIGFGVDEDRNTRVNESGDVVSRIGEKVLVCETDEQVEMARLCALEPRFGE